MPLPTLVGIPLEIRYKIATLLLNDPALPNFESIPPFTTVPNYMALAWVNKQLNSEMTAILQTTRNLAILSSNWDQLPSSLSSHAIAIISTKNLSKLKSHVMRIHVTFPPDCGHHTKSVVESAALILTSSLPSVALLLRSFSLEIPHPPAVPFMSLGCDFPRMRMLVRFEAAANSFSSSELNVSFQKSLVKKLASANHVGHIKIIGAADETIAKLLPGHTEKFTHEPGSDIIASSLQMVTRFHNDRMRDGEDYIKVTLWKLSIAQRAYKAENWDLATHVFDSCISFADAAVENNIYVVDHFSELEPNLATLMFRAGIGLAKILIKTEDWDLAKEHLKVMLEDIDHRPWLGEREARVAKRLARKVKAHFRTKK